MSDSRKLKPGNLWEYDTSLAVHSEKGKKYKRNEDEVSNRICTALRCDAGQFGLDTAHSDRIFFRDGACKCIAEIKSRNMSMLELKQFGTYLISNSKLAYGEELSRMTGIAFYLFVKLIPDNLIVYWNIFNRHGTALFYYDTDVTTTPETCEGGRVERANSFLPLDSMFQLKE